MRQSVRILAAAAVASALAAPALSQTAQTQRVMGTISAVEGPAIVVKTRDGEVKVNLTDKVAVFGVVRATLADVKPGAFIGVGAMPQPDGSQKAIRVMIFAESQRGTGEGHRPWVQPGSTMTNATVDTTVGSVDGQVVMVKYRDGERGGHEKTRRLAGSQPGQRRPGRYRAELAHRREDQTCGGFHQAAACFFGRSS
jgi:hypothetical protein